MIASDLNRRQSREQGKIDVAHILHQKVVQSVGNPTNFNENRYLAYLMAMPEKALEYLGLRP